VEGASEQYRRLDAGIIRAKDVTLAAWGHRFDRVYGIRCCIRPWYSMVA